jgi:hypothetical protein
VRSGGEQAPLHGRRGPRLGPDPCWLGPRSDHDQIADRGRRPPLRLKGVAAPHGRRSRNTTPMRSPEARHRFGLRGRNDEIGPERLAACCHDAGCTRAGPSPAHVQQASCSRIGRSESLQGNARLSQPGPAIGADGPWSNTALLPCGSRRALGADWKHPM